MTQRLGSAIWAGIIAFLTLTSCSKNETISHDRYPEFQNWMNDNVKKVVWADASSFYWQVSQAKLDNVVIQTNGISYKFSPGNNMYPSLEQTTGDFLRTIEIGNPITQWCPNYRETATAVNLHIRTENGKEYRWMNCPVKISEHESNPKSVGWQVNVPSTIELVVVDR